jgi:hypothetical protein
LLVPLLELQPHLLLLQLTQRAALHLQPHLLLLLLLAQRHAPEPLATPTAAGSP